MAAASENSGPVRVRSQAVVYFTQADINCRTSGPRPSFRCEAESFGI